MGKNNSCSLCAKNKFSRLYQFLQYNLAKCEECGLVQILERPNVDELSLIYSERYFKRGKYVKDRAIRKNCQRRVDFLKKAGISSMAKVIDVGCATGDFIEAAKEYFEMWGVDISGYAIEEAKSLNPEISDRIGCQNIRQLSFSEEFFDGMVLWDVLEHLEDPLADLKYLTRFLKPEGILALSTPNIGSLTAKIMGKYWPLMTVPEHLCFFNYETLNILMEKIGFKVLHWESLGTWGNFGFLINKAVRVFWDSSHEGKSTGKFLEKLNGLTLYVPTGDVQYLVARKMLIEDANHPAL